MAQVLWDTKADAEWMLDRLVTPSAVVGARGKEAMQDHTPVASGVLRDSQHFAVVMPDGERVAGDVIDGNGNAVPTYAGNGMIQIVVGTNEAAEVGGDGYADGINRGTRGRAGALFADTAVMEMEIAVKREIG